MLCVLNPLTKEYRPMRNKIKSYMHCRLCMFELPEDASMRDWARLDVGMTPNGLQVWCVRHDVNVGALDFRGQTVRFEDEGPRTKKELGALRKTFRKVRARYVENMRAGKFVDDGALAKFDEQLGRLDAEARLPLVRAVRGLSRRLFDRGRVGGENSTTTSVL
jgi:hypothetical protein